MPDQRSAIADWRSRSEAAFRAARSPEWSDSPEGKRYLEVTSNDSIRPSPALRFRHIIIVTYGRSGSTLRQGVLNNINGVLIRGENENEFAKFYAIVQEARRRRTQFPESRHPNHPWFGVHALSGDVLMDALRPAARSILLFDCTDDPSITTLGFKEILYESFGDSLGSYLDFLCELFPECAVVFNFRDKVDTSASAWWAADEPTSVIDRLGFLEDRFAAYAASRRNCFQIRNDEVLEKGVRLRELFAFLGAPYNPDAVDAVLAVAPQPSR